MCCRHLVEDGLAHDGSLGGSHLSMGLSVESVWPIEPSRLWLIFCPGVQSCLHDDKGHAVFHGVAYCGLLVRFPGDVRIVLAAKDVHQTRAVF
jgi:hypothetical protein